MLQSLLWHCHHPAHMGVCGLHASLWGSLNHQHPIVGYWAVLGLKRCECPLVLGYHVWGYVKIIHIQIARQMILLAWGSLFKLAPGANTQLHWVNAWTHQHVLDASIQGFCQGDMFYQTIWRIPTSCCYKCAKPLNTWVVFPFPLTFGPWCCTNLCSFLCPLPTRRPQPGVLSFGNMNAQYLEKTRNVAQIATADP